MGCRGCRGGRLVLRHAGLPERLHPLVKHRHVWHDEQRRHRREHGAPQRGHVLAHLHCVGLRPSLGVWGLQYKGLQLRTSMPPMDEKVLPSPMSSASVPPRCSGAAGAVCGGGPDGQPLGTPAQKRTDVGWCGNRSQVQPSRHSSLCSSSSSS